MRIVFPDRELDVLTVLWDWGPSTVAEVRNRLRDQFAYNTVLTVLRTLERKGHVGHVVEGKAHRYHVLADRAQIGRSAVSRLIDTVYAGSADVLLTHLVDDRGMDHAQLERLRRFLDERLRTPGNDIGGGGSK